jgi:hypothetical protein
MKSMIDDYSFGRIKVNGRIYTSDIMIIDGRVVDSWWRKAGHRVEFDDIEEILAARPEVLVIGQGKPGLMKVSDGLRKELQKNKIRLIEENTPQAVQTFNRLDADGCRVCAGFHLTC